MVFPKARLAVSAGLFLAWIGFLAYLVAHTRDPVILSRPQVVVSSVIVVAEVKEEASRPTPTVTVKKVVRQLPGQDANWVGAPLLVEGLAHIGSRQGWRGPGAYIIPLTKRGAAYEVTPLPLSPGYFPEFVTVELARIGPDKDKVAELASKLIGPPDNKAEIAPGILRRNVPRQEAEEIKRTLEAVKASVRISEGESRIYRATPDALEQLAELIPGAEVD